MNGSKDTIPTSSNTFAFCRFTSMMIIRTGASPKKSSRFYFKKAFHFSSNP